MTGFHGSGSPGLAVEIEAGRSGAFRPADALALAAMPTFAVMAIGAGVIESGSMKVLCISGHGSVLGGMVPMYALMSLFHLPAWLRLVSGWRQTGNPVA